MTIEFNKPNDPPPKGGKLQRNPQLLVKVQKVLPKSSQVRTGEL